MSKNKLGLKTRIALEAILVALIFVGLLGFSTFLVYSKSLSTLDQEIKIGLVSNVKAAATRLDAELHRTFSADTSPLDPAYLSQAQPLEQIRQASQDIRYIYTNVLIDDKIYFVVNPSPQNDADGDGMPDLPPRLMDPYPDYAQELMQALKEGKAYVSNEPYTDEWGTFISAYAPFFDKDGNVAGTLGMDLELAGFFQRLEKIEVVFEKASITILFLGLVIGLAVWFIRRSNQNNIESLGQLKLDFVNSERYYKNAITESLGFMDGLISSCEQNDHQDFDKEAHLKRLKKMHRYCRSYQPQITEQDNRFKTHQWFERLRSAIDDKNSISCELDKTVPDEVFGKQAFLLEFFTCLLHSLTKVTDSHVDFKLSCEQEQLKQWQLASRIELDDEQTLQYLGQVFGGGADMLFEQCPQTMDTQKDALLEFNRLSHLMPLFDGEAHLETDCENPALVLLWQIDKFEEQFE